MKENKFVWVTGASSGIGKALVKELLMKDFSVGASSRREPLLKELLKDNSGFKNNLQLYPLDVTETESIDQAFNAIKSKNKLFCLINNAGVTSFKPANDNSIKEIRKTGRMLLLF